MTTTGEVVRKGMYSLRLVSSIALNIVDWQKESTQPNPFSGDKAG